MSGFKESGTSVCPVTGRPVATHRYAQFVPLVLDETTRRPRAVVDGVPHAVPACEHEARRRGKLFVSLSASEDDLRHLCESADWSRPWELRHKPPRKLVRVPLTNIARNVRGDLRANSAGTPVLLVCGRCVAADWATLETDPSTGDATVRVDYGVLQSVPVASADEAAKVLVAWRRRLVEQLLS